MPSALLEQPPVQASPAKSPAASSLAAAGPSTSTILTAMSAVDRLTDTPGRANQFQPEATLDLAAEASKTLHYAYERAVVLSLISPGLPKWAAEELRKPNPDRESKRYKAAEDVQYQAQERARMDTKPASLAPFAGVMAVALRTRLQGLGEQVLSQGRDPIKDPGYRGIMHAAAELGIDLEEKPKNQ